MTKRRLCACGCGRWVSREVERQHLALEVPALFASDVPAGNQSLVPVRGRVQRKKPSRRPRKRPSPPIQHSTLSLVEEHSNLGLEEPPHDPPNLLNEGGLVEMYPEEDFPMNEAGPSEVNPGSPILPSPPPDTNDGTGPENHGSLTLRRSKRMAEYIGQQRWKSKHVLQLELDESEEIGESDGEHGATEDEEHASEGEEDPCEEDEDMIPVDPRQEGISAEDLLYEGFSKEVAKYKDEILDESDLSLLRAYALKVEDGLTDKVFNKLRFAFPQASIDTLKNVEKRVQSLSGFRPIRYDCCLNSCICYTGPYENLLQCPKCKTNRYKAEQGPQAYFEYLPIIPRLRAMVANLRYAKQMQYRSNHHHDPTKMTDIFDGTHYRTLLKSFVTIADEELPMYFFSDPRDIALGLSTDGFGPFKRRTKTAWPIILFNYNLPPEERFSKKNIISVGVIPRPKKPCDLDSFLWPLVQELIQLELGVPAFDGIAQMSFLLHAYLILVFGDIPAVSMIMRMKGHNALLPCRMCEIKGVRVPGTRATTHYVPLCRDKFPGSQQSYDSSLLPLRNHDAFMKQAEEVQSAPNNAASERLATEYGIKGVPLLSTLSSLNFPISFPYDFMHLIWSNLIPNLILLWTGSFKDLNHDDEDYVLSPAVWGAIGEATAAAAKTVPAAFGSRVPNVASERSQMIAETYSIWTLFLAPALLKDRFTKERYYKHFIKLVQLLTRCLAFEIKPNQVDDLETGFRDWVEEYEKFYYKHDPKRAACCPVTVHALLHIAPSIRALGPVWAYWAFPMERHCGDILRNIRSRRHPYASINKYVTSCAHLTHITLLYNLHEALCLQPASSHGQAVKFPLYPSYILTPPKRSATPLPNSLWKTLTATLATRFKKPITTIRQLVPQETEVVQYGRACRLEGGDVMHARDLIQLRSDSRDMSFVRYQLEVDKFAHQKRTAPKLVMKIFFGQLLSIFVVNMPSSPQHGIEANSLVYAAIAQVKITKEASDRCSNNYYRNLGSTEIVDLNQVQCVVGRIWDRGNWAIIDRTPSSVQTHIRP